MRHPQYVGFILVMLGFLLQWPTLLTLAMFPVLMTMYGHLAHTEEAEARRTFGGSTTAMPPGCPRGFHACEGQGTTGG